MFLQKTMHFPLCFVYKKVHTLRHSFFAINYALSVTFIYISFIIYILIPNYKRTYDQSDQIDK